MSSLEHYSSDDVSVDFSHRFFDLDKAIRERIEEQENLINEGFRQLSLNINKHLLEIKYAQEKAASRTELSTNSFAHRQESNTNNLDDKISEFETIVCEQTEIFSDKFDKIEKDIHALDTFTRAHLKDRGVVGVAISHFVKDLQEHLHKIQVKYPDNREAREMIGAVNSACTTEMCEDFSTTKRMPKEGVRFDLQDSCEINSHSSSG